MQTYRAGREANYSRHRSSSHVRMAQSNAVQPVPTPALPCDAPDPHATLRTAVQPVPLYHQLGARVEHFYIEPSEPQLASAAIGQYLNIPEDIVARLLWFGAVYTCPVVPLPPPTAAGTVNDETRKRIEAWHQAAIQRHGKNSNLQSPKRLLQDMLFSEGAYFRVHLHPKRFLAAHLVKDWSARVVHHGQEFVVVNKPAGVQVPPTVDNIRESVMAKVEEVLGLDQGCLGPPHRLDVGTEGLVVLTKTAAFARWFQNLLKHKTDRVRKTYRCATAHPPPVGPLVHHLLENQGGLGEPQHTLVLDEPLEGCCRAELHVLQVNEVPLNGRAQQDWGSTAYESEILLITGRTHQIRAQLAHVGCPLLGDDLYSAIHQRSAQSHHSRGQHASEQHAEQQDGSATHTGTDGGSSKGPEPTVPWCRKFQEDPQRPFALQAAKLEVLEDGPMGPPPVMFEAGVPWWRADI